MVYQGNGLKRTKVLDKAFIQYSCGANETTTDNLFTEYLLRAVAQTNVPIIDIFQAIAKAIYPTRQQLFSRNGLARYGSIFLDQMISRTYQTITKHRIEISIKLGIFSKTCHYLF